MLQPKRTKFRKAQKGRMKGISQRGNQLSNGMFGIKSLDSKFITSRQIEAARIAATRYMKREGHVFVTQSSLRASFIVAFALALSPIFSIISGEAPINFIPCSLQILENLAFSDKNP